MNAYDIYNTKASLEQVMRILNAPIHGKTPIECLGMLEGRVVHVNTILKAQIKNLSERVE